MLSSLPRRQSGRHLLCSMCFGVEGIQSRSLGIQAPSLFHGICQPSFRHFCRMDGQTGRQASE
jgi:hypothetical protein